MATWDFQEIWTDESELADDRLAITTGWLGVLVDAGVIQPSTVKAARDAFLAAKGLAIGDAHADYDGAALQSVRVARRDRVDAFDITVTWQNKTGGEDPPDDFDQFMNQSQQDNPENPFGPDYSSHGQFAEEYSHHDVAGNPWLNKANQPLTNIPPLWVTIKVRKVTINQRYEADINQMGVAQGDRLLYSIANEQRTHKNKQTGVLTKYFRTTYEVWHHPFRDWADYKALNIGFAILKDGKLEIPRLGKAKDFPQVEVNLSDDGTRILEDGSPPTTIDFKVFREGVINVPFL